MATFNITNPPTHLDMQYFKSQIDKYGGLTKTCRYAVIIPIPQIMLRNQGFNTPDIGSDLTYLCESTEFPGRGLNTLSVRYYGPPIKLPYNTTYEDINMTFLCRTESFERELFDDWMEYINPTQTFNLNYRDDYSTQIILYQLSEYDSGEDAPKATYAFTLYDAYPVLVNPQPVNWVDNNVQRLTISFTYSKWRRAGKDDINDTKPVPLVSGARITTIL